MDISPILLTDEWADWPKPSPTSPHNINIRFYTVIDDDGVTMRFDIGAVNEEAMEAVYEALAAGRLKMTPVEFERFMRNIFQTRMENLTAYTVILSQYAVLTADTKEVQRSLHTERYTLTRALKLMPYRLLPDLLTDDVRPKNRYERVTRWIGHQFTRLRLLFHLFR